MKNILLKFRRNDKVTLSQDNYVEDLKNENPIFENRVQENFSFSQSKIKNEFEKKFKLPPLEFLIKPKVQKKTITESNVDESFLEKILLDFGVEGEN